MRIARDMQKFAASLIDTLVTLPAGVRIDGISVDPTQLPFGKEEYLTFPDDSE